jgi:hypothetical protein
VRGGGKLAGAGVGGGRRWEIDGGRRWEIDGGQRRRWLEKEEVDDEVNLGRPIKGVRRFVRSTQGGGQEDPDCVGLC